MGTGVEEAAVAEGAKGAAEATTAATTVEAGATEIGAGAIASGTGSDLVATTAAGEAAGAGAALGAATDTAIQVAKTAAPIVSAASSLAGAEAGIQQAENAKKLAAGATLATPAVAPIPQAAIDPDLTAIRKKNALLFGMDSPASTDITKGKALPGDLGRATLLGGSSELGS